MKLHEEFTVPHGLDDVWAYFEQPTAVAACMPGVEAVNVIDDDHVEVRATQSIGPMTATFEAKVAVIERVPKQLIRFRSTGRSVRGAIGNVRTENAVHLEAGSAGTTVRVDGDIVLAGALGSVGQKVVAKQAGKVTAQFASNLQRALSGEPVGVLAAPDVGAIGRSDGATVGASFVTADRSGDLVGSAERWSKIAAALSAVSALLSLIAILRQRRGPLR